MKVTFDTVRELLDYCPDSGQFVWRQRDRHWFTSDRWWKAWNTRYSGKSAGSLYVNSQTGYQCIVIMLGKKPRRAHRIAYLWMTGSPAPSNLDHKDQDATNNRWSNIRLASHHINNRNVRIRANNTSGVNGVSWNKRVRKWEAYANGENRKRVALGFFDNIDEAERVVKRFRSEHGYTKNHGAKR